MKKLIVLVSGNGTNLQAIIDAIEYGRIDASISAVIADRECFALERAEKHKIRTFLLKRTPENKEHYFHDLMKLMEDENPDLIVHAGFMKILPPFIVEKFPMKMINIHPALLPCFGGKGFYGMHVHEAVINSGARISGCSVHFVTEDVDGGPIIIQKTIEIADDDTPESLAEKIHVLEHKAVVEAVEKILTGNYKIEGKRVVSLH